VRRLARGAGLALILALPAMTAMTGCDADHEYQVRDLSAPRGAVTAGLLFVNVRFPAGAVRLHAATDDSLYHASVTYCARHLAPSAALSDATLDLSLTGKTGGVVGFGGEENVMRLDLTDNLPQALDLNLGEGESVLDLSGLPVRRFHLMAGAGDTRVIFGRPNAERADDVTIEGTVGDIGVDLLGNANAASTRISGGVGGIEVDLRGDWRRHGSVEIDASVGDVVLWLPRGPGVRLTVGSPWREKLALPGYTRQDDAWVSEGYETAAPRIEVKVLPGIGRLSVQVDPSSVDPKERSR